MLPLFCPSLAFSFLVESAVSHFVREMVAGAYWMDDVISCPVHAAIVQINQSLMESTSQGTYELGRKLLLVVDGSVMKNETTWDSDAAFDFAVPTILFAILSFQALVFMFITLFRLHGVRILMAGEYTAEESIALIRERRVSDNTNNLYWVLYFAAEFCLRGLCVVALQVHDMTTAEPARITIFVENLFLGLACLCLAMALNHERIFKIKDYPGARVSDALRRQVTRMNRGSFALFVLYLVADFIVSHLTSDHDTVLNETIFWIYFVFLIILALPYVLAMIWVALHDAEVEPRFVSKVVLFIGVTLHTLVMLPPEFWNKHVLKGFVKEHPCPAKYLSVYNFVLIGQFIGMSLVFAFVWLEHKRNALIEIDNHYSRVSQSLNSEHAIMSMSTQRSIM